MENPSAHWGVLDVHQLYHGATSTGFLFEVKRGVELIAVLELNAAREAVRLKVAEKGGALRTFDSLSRGERDQIDIFMSRVKELCRHIPLERHPNERLLPLAEDKVEELVTLLRLVVRKRA